MFKQLQLKSERLEELWGNRGSPHERESRGPFLESPDN